MANLGELRELYAFMRDAGDVLHARCGELELHLAVRPAVLAVTPDAPPSTDDDERRSLEDLLYSSGADADALLSLMRGKAA